jgi:hypothetical protein
MRVLAARLVDQLDRRPRLAGGVAVAPLHERDQDGIQVPSLVGEPVLEALRALLVGAALEDPLRDQPLEPVGEDVARAG